MDMKEAVAEILGPPQKRSGEWWFWPCPFHDDEDPSFGVKGDGGYCFGVGCHWSGDLSWFLKCMGITDVEAEQYKRHDLSKVVKRKRGLKLPPLPPAQAWRDFFNEQVRFCAKMLWMLGGQGARGELARRGISDEVAQRYYIGYNPSWLEVPQFETHLAQGIVLPAYAEDKLWSVNVYVKGKIKYHRPEGGSSCLFGLQQLQYRPVLVICEGELDALTAATALGDDGDAVALRGAQQSIREWMHFFNGYYRIVLALDGDEAGKDATLKILDVFPKWESRQPPESADDLGKMYEAGYDVKRFLLNGWKL